MVWTCSDCGKKMQLANTVKPNLCCFCGGKSIASPESKKRLETYRRYDEELEGIAAKLNELHKKEEPLHIRYYEIMQYFRTQKRRGLITDEQYRYRADKYDGLRGKRGK